MCSTSEELRDVTSHEYAHAQAALSCSLMYSADAAAAVRENLEARLALGT